MKVLLALASVLSGSLFESIAQGVVNANSLSGGVSIYVADATINNGAPVKIGTEAVPLFGSGLGPGQVFMAMYAAPIGTPFWALQFSTPVWTGYNSTSTLSTQQGSVAPGSAFALPLATDFAGGTAVEFLFYGAAAGNSYPRAAWSSIGTTTPITTAQADAGMPAPTVWGGPSGITSMVFVNAPEPATIALGGLGVTVLLLSRHRK